LRSSGFQPFGFRFTEAFGVDLEGQTMINPRFVCRSFQLHLAIGGLTFQVDVFRAESAALPAHHALYILGD